MTKLEELIQELCPDGVEYKLLSDIATDIYRGSGIKRDQVTETGIPCVRYGEIYTSYNVWFDICISHTQMEYVPNPKYFEYGDILFAITGESVEEIAKSIAYVGHEKCLAGGDTVVLKHNQNPKYMAYALSTTSAQAQKSKGKVKSKVVHSSVPAISEIIIPIPPLAIQSEIVRILDNFTELTARQKQYNYYRNKLLTFNGADIPIVQLRTVVKKSCSGSTPTKGNSDYYENGTIPWIRTQDVRFNEITEVDSYITEKAVAETAVKWIPENCVIVAISGATAGRCAINKIKATTNQHCLNLEIDESKALHRYIYYCIYNKYDELISRKQGARGDLNSSLVLSLEIPVPALDVQKRLVYVLDNFDAICSDLKIGLPAEIEARQKQYEFYRDALLTYAATGKTILTDRQTDELNGLILLCQYVFGFVSVTLNMISENHDSKRKPITSGNREAGEYPYYGASGIVDYVSGYIFDGDYLLVSEDGNNLVARSTPIAFSISGKNWVNNHAHVLKFDCYATRRYVEFYLNSIDLSQFISGGAQPKLNQKNLNTIPIPLPAIKEQEHIVGILDRFDALCNDISSGLPAEIEARTKQYEYYRDKLLSFKGENI